MRLLAKFGIYALLAAAATLPYARVGTLGFTNFDDPEYVTQNPHVRAGLTWESFAWAFTSTEQANWHPLTWLSHMMDCQLYGLNPGGPHLTNLMFHLGSTLLLFWALRRMTRAPGRSAVVAALFAVHPLHVESVAWIAERKDVLSAFFWMLALAAYVHYVESSRPVKGLWVVLWMALGLAAKPMLVTLPFALLLLDIWPLARFGMHAQAANKGERKPPRSGPLAAFSLRHPAVVEKIPLLLLSLLSSIVTYWVQQKGGAVMTFHRLPFGTRLANAAVSYGTYVKKMLWPSDLAPFYPLPDAIGWGRVAESLLWLALATYLAIRLFRHRSYIAVGWFWFLGTLIPVIGLIQVGDQALADRYTYIPLIGLLLIIAWGGWDLSERWHLPRLVPAMAAFIPLCALAAATWTQTGCWMNSITLFRHAIEVTGDNQRAYVNLGAALAAENRFEEAISVYQDIVSRRKEDAELQARLAMTLAMQGRNADAIEHYRHALRINPAHAEAHNGLGYALALGGELEEALPHHLEALRLKPKFPEARYNLGKIYAAQQKPQLALEQFAEALRLRPDYYEAHEKMALTLAGMNRLDEALPHFEAAIQGTPDQADLRYRYGMTLYQQQRPLEAMRQLREAIRLKPDWPEALGNLAWILATYAGATLADGAQSVAYIQKAMALAAKQDAAEYDTYAAALARAGRFEEAVTSAEQALRLARALGNAPLAADIARRLQLYKSGRSHSEILR
jgi:tetratricopeptide (TPR) repeat protein